MGGDLKGRRGESRKEGRVSSEFCRAEREWKESALDVCPREGQAICTRILSLPTKIEYLKGTSGDKKPTIGGESAI